jgi:hypothetical protein
MPTEYATQRPSSEKAAFTPYAITTTESEPMLWIRSSSSSLTRPMGAASQRPSGDSLPEPRDSHWP